MHFSILFYNTLLGLQECRSKHLLHIKAISSSILVQCNYRNCFHIFVTSIKNSYKQILVLYCTLPGVGRHKVNKLPPRTTLSSFRNIRSFSKETQFQVSAIYVLYRILRLNRILKLRGKCYPLLLFLPLLGTEVVLPRN